MYLYNNVDRLCLDASRIICLCLFTFPRSIHIGNMMLTPSQRLKHNVLHLVQYEEGGHLEHDAIVYLRASVDVEMHSGARCIT